MPNLAWDMPNLAWDMPNLAWDMPNLAWDMPNLGMGHAQPMGPNGPGSNNWARTAQGPNNGPSFGPMHFWPRNVQDAGTCLSRSQVPVRAGDQDPDACPVSST